ncbi:MAG: hypothetical protein RBS29_09530, partial [Bacteroidales bacterium]|nr:hypothetical protein [Bacteroidales bacterium]
PALKHRPALEKIGIGILKEYTPSQNHTAETPDTSKPANNNHTNSEPIFARTLTLADVYIGEKIYLTKYVRRLINWHGRQVHADEWDSKALPRILTVLKQQKMECIKVERLPDKITALLDLSELTLSAVIDQEGVALYKPASRMTHPSSCQECAHLKTCQSLSTSPGAVLLWRRLGLISSNGTPTMRGRIASFFSGGPGLAIAAAIEDKKYPLEELLYDLANLDAGFRFAGDENRWGGRLAWVSKKTYKMQTAEGYLEHGVPPEYGFGASDVVAALQQNPEIKYRFVSPTLGVGDIDRIIIEWRSRMRQVAHSPSLDNERWTAFQQLCKETLQETESPTLLDLPPLEFAQTRRMEHTLKIPRH